jgi:glutaredoxin-like YruB-family protein
MSLIVVTSPEQIDAHLAEGQAIIGFFGSFSALSEQARPAFEAFAEQVDGATVLLVDVGQVKGVHKRFDVASVPAAVTVAEGRVIRRAAGLHDEEGWGRALLPHASSAPVGEEGGPRRPSVTVYTSPTCSWCGRLKDYLDQHAVAYREVNIAADPAAAQELVQRSGQMGVPQTDVGGQIVVGFDRPRLDRLLGLQAA